MFSGACLAANRVSMLSTSLVFTESSFKTSSSSKSISLSKTPSFIYEYAAADRNDCRVFTNEWCHYSCTHYPPVCPNCCVKL